MFPEHPEETRYVPAGVRVGGVPGSAREPTGSLSSCRFMPRPHEGPRRDVLLACAELAHQSAYLLFLVHPHRERTMQTKVVLPQRGPKRVERTHARWNRTPDSASQAAEVLRSLRCALLHVWCLGQDSRNVWATSQTPTVWHCLVSTQEPSHLHGDVGGSMTRGVPCPQLFLWPQGLSCSPFLIPAHRPHIECLPGLSANQLVKSPSGRVLGYHQPH